MHILIIPSYPYQTEYMPLAGIFQKHQAECLAAAGHSVGVLSAGLLPFASVVKRNLYASAVISDEAGITVARRHGKALLPQRLLSPGMLAGAIVKEGLEAFGAYVKRNGMPDVAHAHDCLYAGVLAKALKEKHGLPYVVTEHSSAHLRNLLDARQEAYVREALAGASGLTAVSSASARLLEKKYGGLAAAKNVPIIYNLLEASFEDAGLPPAPPQNGFTFLNVANLYGVKNHRNLISAFAQVLKRHPDARLHIGGAGPMRTELESQIAAAGLEGSVRLLGYLRRPQVMEEMAACGAFALSSDVETFGVVLIEAMAMGKPVVSTACGGPEDIVDSASGLLVPTGDADALAGAMLKVMDNQDSFNAQSIREHCIERFGREAFRARLEEVYQKAAPTLGRLRRRRE